MKFFKYFPPERIYDFFPNFTLKATPPNCFNDVYECFISIPRIDKNTFIKRFLLDRRDEILRNAKSGNILDDSVESKLLYNFAKEYPETFNDAYSAKINEYIKDPTLLENKKNALKQILYSEACRKMGIMCFSRNFNNPLMWGHYTKEHTGFVAEFELSDEELNKYSSTVEPKGFGIREVIYTNQIPEMSINNFYDMKLPKYFAYTKDLRWSYEEEIRWVIPSELTYKNNLIDMRKEIGDNFLNSITLGIRAFEIESQMRDILKKLTNVRLYKAIQSPDNYVISRKLI